MNRGRFAIITNTVYGDINTFRDISEPVNKIVAKYPEVSNKLKSTGTQKMPLIISDDALLVKAKQAKNSNKFISLFEVGELGSYSGDDSAGDQALCNLLAFLYTRCRPN